MTIDIQKRLIGLEQLLDLLSEEEAIRLLKRSTIKQKPLVFDILSSFIDQQRKGNGSRG